MSQHAMTNPAPGLLSLLRRLFGIILFDTRAFEAVRQDPRATRQSIVIVVVTQIVISIYQLGDVDLWLIAAPLLFVALWPLGAWLDFKIGTRILGASAPGCNWIQILRLTGFAQILSILGVVRSIDVVGPVLDWG
jgi:hypothetical protein